MRGFGNGWRSTCGGGEDGQRPAPRGPDRTPGNARAADPSHPLAPVPRSELSGLASGHGSVGAPDRMGLTGHAHRRRRARTWRTRCPSGPRPPNPERSTHVGEPAPRAGTRVGVRARMGRRWTRPRRPDPSHETPDPGPTAQRGTPLRRRLATHQTPQRPSVSRETPPQTKGGAASAAPPRHPPSWTATLRPATCDLRPTTIDLRPQTPIRFT